MPVEAQSRAPLGRRDRRLLALLALALLAGAAALGVVLATRGSSSNAGCVVVAVPSTLGGATLRSCGRAAHDFCRTQGRKDEKIAAACRKQGFTADLP